MSDNYFDKLNRVDVTNHIEKKGRFSYLSWAYAVRELKKAYPNSYFVVEEYDGKPFMKTDEGYFVKVTVTVEGVSQAQIHPVLNHQNKTIKEPDAFQINTSIQRCLAKAIALHGLGIHIYAGEDLPEHDGVQMTPPPPPAYKPPTETFKIEKTAEMPNQGLSCPKCKIGKIVDSRTAIACDRQKDGCEFVALKRGSNMNVDDMKTMLKGEETRVLKMQKKGGGTYYGSYSISDDLVPEFKFRTEACFELGAR